MENEAVIPAVVRTFVVSDVRCSCCESDQSTYSLFARNQGTNVVSETFICVVCDLGERA